MSLNTTPTDDHVSDDVLPQIIRNENEQERFGNSYLKMLSKFR